MTYNVFGGTLNLAVSIYLSENELVRERHILSKVLILLTILVRSCQTVRDRILVTIIDI